MNSDEILKFLDQLASKLTEPAQHIFNILVWRAEINAIFFSLVGIVFFVVGVVLFWKLRNAVILYNTESKDERGYSYGISSLVKTKLEVFGVLEVIFGGFSTLFGLIIFLGNIVDVFTPEYRALADLISKVAGNG